MFHIKPDKRSQASAVLVVQGLYKCMEEKPFAAITITDVQRASTVGRATFYRLFDTLPDVLAYQCDQVFQQLVTIGKNTPNMPHRAVHRIFFAAWQEHETLLKAIIASNHMELIYGTYRRFIPAIKEIMASELSLDEEETDYAAGFIIASIVSILETWVKRGQTKTPEELALMFEKSVSILGKDFESEQTNEEDSA